MKKIKTYLKFIKKNKIYVLLLIIFLSEIFLRTYQAEIKNPFGYDQVDNAWAAKNLIVNNNWPLLGMVAKANSGIYIGPLYYYFVAFFYWIYGLNPAASLTISFISSVFTFFTIFYVAKKLFSYELAIIAIVINTFCFSIIIFDGIQWPVQLLPAVSMLIFYFLYKVITKDIKKLIPLAIFTGIAFNLHFTAIFFPIIILLSLPFFPKNKKTLKYILISIPCFLIFLIPNIIYLITNNSVNLTTSSYLSTYYHGFHLQRMFQIVGDAFIQFDPYLVLDKVKPYKFLLLPLFFIVFYKQSLKLKKIRFLYLVFLWFIIPWLIFTVYSGEISDYYFIISRFIVLLILSYFIYLIWSIKHKFVKVLVILFLLVYSYYGVLKFLPYKDEGNFVEREKKAREAVDSERRIEFQVGVPESYYYYYLMRKEKGMEVY